MTLWLKEPEQWREWKDDLAFSTHARLRRLTSAGSTAPAGFLFRPRRQIRTYYYFITQHGKTTAKPVAQIWADVWPNSTVPELKTPWFDIITRRNTKENEAVRTRRKESDEKVECFKGRKVYLLANQGCPFESGAIKIPGFDIAAHPDLGLGCWPVSSDMAVVDDDL